MPWWNRERTFQSHFVCHSPKKRQDDSLHGEKKFMAAETTESTLKDNISSFSLLRLIRNRAWKGHKFCWYLQFSLWKGECQVQEVIKARSDTLFMTFIDAAFLRGRTPRKQR